MNNDEKHIPTGEEDDSGDYALIEVTDPGEANDQGNPLNTVDVTDPEDAYSNIVNQYFDRIEELNEAIAYLKALTADNVTQEVLKRKPKHLTEQQLNFLRMIIKTVEMTDSLSEVNAAIESLKKGISRVFQEMDEED